MLEIAGGVRSPADDEAEEATMPAKNLTNTVAAGVEAWNRHDPDAFAALFAEDAELTNPIQPEPVRGREAIRKDAAEFQRAFPDVRLEMVSQVADSERVAFELKVEGTHTGPLATTAGEIAPTNRRFEARSSIFVRANGEGRIVEERRYFDVARLMEQLGVS
jgi:steroid delta-isomerase-like uncharacterized protein